MNSVRQKKANNTDSNHNRSNLYFYNNKILQQQEELEERNRRLEYGEELYDHFFKPCDNCFLIFHTRHLFYINDYNETIKVCKSCLQIINYEERTRELRRKYDSNI